MAVKAVPFGRTICRGNLHQRLRQYVLTFKYSFKTNLGTFLNILIFKAIEWYNLWEQHHSSVRNISCLLIKHKLLYDPSSKFVFTGVCLSEASYGKLENGGLTC